MATIPWSIPTGKAITGATYIKDTDDNIAATIEDLVDWCNNANGTYNDYTLTGLRTDFVDIPSAQTITGAKTFSSNINGLSIKTTDGGTSSLLINKTLGTSLSGMKFTTADVEKWVIYTSNDGTEDLYFRSKDSSEVNHNVFQVYNSTGIVNFFNMPSVNGNQITANVNEINILDGVTLTTSDINKLVSGTWTPTATSIQGLDATPVPSLSMYSRVGNIVTVSIYTTVDPTSTAVAKFRLSLPIASNFTSINTDVIGNFTVASEPMNGYVSANTTNNEIEVGVYAHTATTATTMYITAQYTVK